MINGFRIIRIMSFLSEPASRSINLTNGPNFLISVLSLPPASSPNNPTRIMCTSQQPRASWDIETNNHPGQDSK